MSRYSVTVEHDEEDSFLAWVHEFPGCYAHGRTRAEALANVEPAIERFRNWLRGIGEAVDQEPIRFKLVDAERMPEAHSGILLTWDQGPLTAKEWGRVERWLDHSRKELLDLLDQMGDQELETAARDGARSIAGQLRHLANVEYMYALWTFDFHSIQDLKEFLDWTRRMAFERLRVLADRSDHRLTSAEWSGNDNPDPWTARKAARRLVYHERWHLNSIRRLLTGFRGREASGES